MAMQNQHQIIIIGVFVLSALGLITAAINIQLVDEKYKDRADRATINKEVQYPSRGLIYDRNQELLVYNNPLYDIQAVYSQIDPDMDTLLLCQLLGINKATFIKNINKDWSKPQYAKTYPFTFLSKIKPEQYHKFQEHLDDFPGFTGIIRNIRGYPHSNAAHVLGYLGEVNREVVDTSKGKYIPGDYIGISGIERTYEEELRGVKGIKLTQKDNLGRKTGSFNEGNSNTAAVSGNDLITTIDINLQAYAESLLQNKRGSVVAIEPSTGEILAMLSSPSYDPNIFNLDRDRRESIAGLLLDSLNRPSIDRSIMSKYPPGSVFKPIFALIAMQEGISYPGRTIYCDGSYEVNTKGFSQGCHNHPTPYNCAIALEHSCNSYFYQLMREFLNSYGVKTPGKAMDRLTDYLSDFGLGKPLGIDLMFENSGFIPDGKYFDKKYSYVRNGWRSTYVLSLGIGQGELGLTTTQMANLAAILANRGYYVTPHLVRGMRDASNSYKPIPYQKKSIGIDAEYYPIVVDGMERVIRSGTASNSYVQGIDICGKTGTSQNPQGDDHSVFFGFAPKDDPKIAIAVYVENAGSGGHIAAPIGSLVIEKYLNKEIYPYRLPLERRLKNTVLLQQPKS